MEVSIEYIEEIIKTSHNEGLNEGIRKYRHLCTSCLYEIVTCQSTPEFGEGYGKDNVYNCPEHKLRSVT